MTNAMDNSGLIFLIIGPKLKEVGEEKEERAKNYAKESISYILISTHNLLIDFQL